MASEEPASEQEGPLAAFASLAKLARVACQGPSSLRELVGSDAAMWLVVSYLGPVGAEGDKRSLEQALWLARVVPGLCLTTRIKVGPAGASLLGEDTCLHGLYLRKGCSWEHLFKALKVNKGLRLVDLSKCGLEPADVVLLSEAVAVHPTLARLNLHKNHVGDDGGSALATVLSSNVTLRVVNFKRAQLSVEGARVLASSLSKNTGLEEFDVDQNFTEAACASLGRAMASALRVNSTLVKLTLSRNRKLGDTAGAAVLKALIPNRTVRELRMSAVGLGMTCGETLGLLLARNNTLVVIDVSCNFFGRWLDANSRTAGAAHWPQICAGLERNVGLRELDLQGCGITHVDSTQVSNALEARPGFLLLGLALGANGWGAVGFNSVLRACLKPGSALRKLNVGHMRIPKESVGVLAEVVKASDMLEELDLNNAIMGDGRPVERGRPIRAMPRVPENTEPSCWPEFFAALEAHATLRTLNLTNCNLRTPEVAAMARMLEANGVLRELHLFKAMEGYEDSLVLAAAVGKNRSLQRLNMSGNKIGKVGIQAFVEVLQSQATCPWGLKHFDLRGNRFPVDTKRAVQQAARAAGCTIVPKWII